MNAGYLAIRMLDVLQNGDIAIAVLDTSAACHMPDVLEMPYQPPLYGADEPNSTPCVYRLAGPTCLAGDIIGNYNLAKPLREGDLLLFGDMAIYYHLQNNSFNGTPLLAQFRYSDFKGRLDSR